MENTRRGDGRKGQPHNNTGNRKDQPLLGFEGMNYEQKRKPYGEGNEKVRNTNPDRDSNPGKRRDDL
jgi:hypothetical protein